MSLYRTRNTVELETEEWVSSWNRGFKKLNRRFAFWQNIRLNPFASRQIAQIVVFGIRPVLARVAPVLVTIL